MNAYNQIYNIIKFNWKKIRNYKSYEKLTFLFKSCLNPNFPEVSIYAILMQLYIITLKPLSLR